MKTDTGSTSRLRHDPLVRGLGWASALLGVPQVAAPGGFARTLGVDDTSRHRSATTAVGVRELAAATGLLGRPHPAWLWGRVGGDLMDLTMLTRALRNHNGRGLGRTVVATAAVAAITATDVYAAVTRTRRSTLMELTAATTVTQPPDEVYGLWSDLERLPDFMAHLDEVRVTGPRTSHWRAGAPFGKTVEWDAETTQDVPGQLIAWRSVDGADIDNSGEVRFVPAPGGRGTEIRVTLRYDLPGGALGKTAARYFGEEPHQQLDDDLRRFKQIAETGEIVRSEGAPGGKRARGEFPQHPARPLTEDELKEALA
ncbi:cyclase/dehydrase [Streptomyces viridosporus ATCC 14672]|uniref:Cyclase/dehydrase n=1 Tax=Streptomyces viridosporus (strain ATCC 14672 / DSM 40746 / JCM 4963 / KCTC 9882 / NRRL B-12104 / FH 1290) TaxID=566461 RepID=D6A8Z2_STRV1|nr:SRPBCC family protein [Streptomyces viridosporus]EFE66210.1 cyclase/dehydrase [Streptomyces viridosporus ATCC 14672]